MSKKMRIEKFLIILLAIFCIGIFAQHFVSGTGIWATKSPMPTARNAISSGVIDGIIYVVGGTSMDDCSTLATNEAYNPATDTWTTKAPMLTPRRAFGTGVLNGLLYTVGGDGPYACGNDIAVVEAYDPATDSWMTKAPLPIAVRCNAVVAVDGILYSIGRASYCPVNAPSVFAYNPITNTWTPKAPMLIPTNPESAVVVDGIIYIFGGDVCGDVQTFTVQAYNPLTDTWSMRSTMPRKHYRHSTAVVDGIIYIAGGGNDEGITSTVDAYDPATDTWSTVPSMPTGRIALTAAVVDGIIYEIGGWNFTDHSVNTVEAYNPSPNKRPDCSQARASTEILWPANHAMFSVSITGITDPDNDPVSITITSVMQDEPTDGLGDGDMSPDAVVKGDKVLIRAERSGTGNGRVYHINFIADDGKGGECQGMVTVTVPHNRGVAAVDEGALYDSTIP